LASWVAGLVPKEELEELFWLILGDILIFYLGEFLAPARACFPILLAVSVLCGTNNIILFRSAYYSIWILNFHIFKLLILIFIFFFSTFCHGKLFCQVVFQVVLLLIVWLGHPRLIFKILINFCML
jgi:hypothetical protein